MGLADIRKEGPKRPRFNTAFLRTRKDVIDLTVLDTGAVGIIMI